MDTPLNAPSLLRRYGIRPNKRLGQHFLVDSAALQRVVDAAEISACSSVLEVGAGLGGLTRFLAERAQRVVAVELDSRLIPILEEVLSPYPNVDIIQGDILELSPHQLVHALPYMVVANIPYYITAALLRHLLEAPTQPDRLVLTVQREVADRLCATEKLSLLALSVQVYGEPRVVARIPAGAFYPPPNVDSAVIRVDLLPEPLIPSPLLPTFFQLANAGFGQKRKTLANALSGGMGWSKEQAISYLQATSIDPRRRAETLSIEEWHRLVISCTNSGNLSGG
ncbi:MAG: 16S rRNA (adenine(1518)-N(6)/adenine(1519)-N(6))-dimethyltransferase RsmA [Chloroflexota bacterium]